MISISFRDKLKSLINEENIENGSNTPDFILREYLCDCLEAFDRAVVSRDRSHGQDTWINSITKEMELKEIK